MAKSPEEMAAAMKANLKQNTGKDMSGWLKILKAAKLAKHGERVKHLKSEHGMTHGYANLVAHELKAAEAGGGTSTTDLVEAQYSGPKAALRPIYDALIAAVNKLGNDAEISPKKSYVSLRRSKQFGLIQASTKTRVDLGLNLKGHENTERLEASGSFNSMVSHRVRLTDKKQVDAELKRWLKQAYESA